MPEYQRWKNIMKAYPFEEKRLAKWNPPYIVQPKYDGVRCRVIPLHQGYILLSSEENIIYSVPHINEMFNRLEIKDELDGELYCHGMSFEQIVSITSRTVNLHDDHKEIQFHLFDVVNGQSQMQRQLYIENLRDQDRWLKVAPFWICYNLDDIMRIYNKLIDLSYEGIIVRNIYASYERKRSVWIMKFKPKKEDEYEIVGTQEEYDKDGNPKDTLGALICKSGDGNLFNVGTGFSEERRHELWDIKSLLPGMKAKVQYQHITTGKQVPRFPVFVEIITN
jgi:DNA ligase-1